MTTVITKATLDRFTAEESAAEYAAMAAPEELRHVSQVMLKLRIFDKELEHLENIIGKLDERLAMVLRTSVPSENARFCGPSPTEQVALATMIEERVDRLGALSYRLNDISDRIEVYPS